MSSFTAIDFCVDLFLLLRQHILTLGLKDLFAVLSIVDQQWPWPADEHEEYRLRIRLLWCRTSGEEQIFDELWVPTFAHALQDDVGERAAPPPSLPPAPPPPEVHDTFEQQQDERAQPDPSPNAASVAAQWEPLPFYVPLSLAPVDEAFELGSYWPIAHRQMVYAWRYLRRPVADGPCDRFDLDATLAATIRYGLFRGPVYRRRERNHAQLILLLDQNGSMMPFHRFTRDLATTAQYESSIAHVEVYYFHNAPSAYLYRDPHLTNPLPLDAMLATCTPDTSLLIVSDGGAARGYRRPERIRATRTFLRTLERHTLLHAWLNPMPRERWADSSAQVIAALLQGRMFQMDEDGFSQAIDVIRM
ncbi:MAG: VWA domain-containing protein [Candidatus Viridilinea halotolerans]|uniref:VWA domain-containing protein n=1 Tax=Candidatus Viridilinea halotolerans TaxID=2491704 RepID=A0A426TVE0_9CHLR|nr:MAG: VWA domain-containing protein [Candidatus Viridilinea halotolerans]